MIRPRHASFLGRMLVQMVSPTAMTVSVQKIQQMTLEKKMDQSPFERRRDCLKLSSASGPRMKAMRKGAAGTPSLRMPKPTTPMMNITVTSKIELFTA